MEDEVATIIDLERMATRAKAQLRFVTQGRKSLFPPNMEWVKAANEFITECHRFQMDILKRDIPDV